MQVHGSYLQLEAITIPLWLFLPNRHFSLTMSSFLLEYYSCYAVLIRHLFPNWVVSAFCHLNLHANWWKIHSKPYLKTEL